MGLERAPTMTSVSLIVRSKLVRAPWRKFSTATKSKTAAAMDIMVKMAVIFRDHKDRMARERMALFFMRRPSYSAQTKTRSGQNARRGFGHG